MRFGCMVLLCNVAVDSVIGETSPIISQVKKETELRGRVTDAATGEVIIGASVMLEGTTIGAITDLDGNYSIPYPGGRHTVVASYLT